MNPKDTYLYSTIVNLVKGFDDKEKAVVGLMYAAMLTACQESQRLRKEGEGKCTHCMFNCHLNCVDILNFCEYHGSGNTYEDEHEGE